MRGDLFFQVNAEIQNASIKVMQDNVNEQLGKGSMLRDEAASIPSIKCETIYAYEGRQVLRTIVTDRFNKETGKFTFTVHMEQL